MSDWPLWQNVVVFALAAVVITIFGFRLAGVADRLADRTGLGEAITGAVLLGAATSLPGITTSITAALAGRASLAISNAMGGIAAQTAFLAIADFAYRRVNLEHAAASVPNLIHGTLVIVLLAGVLLAGTGPNVSLFGIHPITPLLALGYLGGVRLARRSHAKPAWLPRRTKETFPDIPAPGSHLESLLGLWLRFAGLATVLVGSGWLVAKTGAGVATQTGLSDSVVGGLFTAVATSTPELVTTVAAVRRGALTLAVGGILGGNAFDVMFAVAADVAYTSGSIYHAVAPREWFLTTLSIVMIGVIVMGMLYREKRGVVGIGFESALVLLLYTAGLLVVSFG